MTQYVHDWTHHQIPQMYGLLDAASRRATTEPQFAAALARAASAATMVSLRPTRVFSAGAGTVGVRMRVSTRVWGTLRETLTVPLTGSGSGARVHFNRRSCCSPDCDAGSSLRRTISLPPRAAILASDGEPLATGPGRTSPIPDVAGADRRHRRSDSQRPRRPNTPRRATRRARMVGLDGLEHIFQSRLVGTRGGRLLAGHRLLASAAAVAGPAGQDHDLAGARAGRDRRRWAATTPASRS